VNHAPAVTRKTSVITQLLTSLNPSLSFFANPAAAAS
jgi:hypothetical protein